MANQFNNRRQNRPKNPKHPDPMSTPTLRGWEGIRIMRDISKGRFNLDKDGPLFRNIEFVRDTINEAQKEYAKAYYHYHAMMFAYGAADDPMIRSIIEKDGGSINAYNLIIVQLSNIINYRDTGYLQVLINQLPRFRKYL